MQLTKLLIGFFLLSGSCLYAQNSMLLDSLKKHVYYLADDTLEGRSIGANGGDKAARYIVDQFKQLGLKPVGPDYYHHFVHKTQAIASEGKNIIGVIEGSHPVLKNEYIVIGAHYDHIGYYFNRGDKIVYNGADDNASGVASVIELARLLSTTDGKFKRSVAFVAFDGEESGLNGSRWMVTDRVLPIENIKFMLSIDMVGMLEKNGGIELKGTGTFENGSIISHQIADRNALQISKVSKALSNRTDTKPFGQAGIPALHITTGTVSPYHEPEDDAHLLDYEGMVKISEFIYDFMKTMANMEEEQIVSKLPPPGKTKFFVPGIRLNIGSSFHNYPDNFYNANKALALQTGFYAQLNLTKRIALQPEVLYETLGSDHPGGKFRCHSLTVPVNIMYKFAGNDLYETWMHLMAGAYYTHNLSGKVGSSKITFPDPYEQSEYGLNFGFVIKSANVQLGYIHKLGLSNLYSNSANGNIMNTASMAVIGINF